MGLLDDLKLEVQKIRAEELERNAEFESQEKFYDEYLKPVMVRTYGYLSEIVGNLNIVVPDIHPSYPLNPSLKHGVTLNQANYEFHFDNRKSPRQIDILCTCILDQPQEFHVATEEAVVKHADLLKSYKFHYHQRNRLDKLHNIRGATFILEGPMNVHIRVFAHAADKCIYIDLRNLENQPFKRYKFSPDKVDDELLERLARLLIREESTLVEVKVCDNVRDELRRRLELEKCRDEEDLAEAYAHMEAERLAEKNAKLINRTKRAVAEGVGQVLKAFSKR
ncbi:MAG: hypothetical protein DRR42_13985 [Gammaproteobacteria bacterium]|nr:MAG: hypothetical protein DRR42_13985 [Gammaproteobacteria bacterium]